MNFFEFNGKGKEIWLLLCKRIFNWVKEIFVGLKKEYDLVIWECIKLYNKGVDVENCYKWYEMINGLLDEENLIWFGYEKLFLINDYVFFNGLMIIV